MKLIGLMPVRNEAHELGLTLRAALQWCDEVVCLDHASTDKSAEMISKLHVESGKRVSWRHESNPSWDEMPHRQRMLEMARMRGATHIAIIDADEILTGNMLPYSGDHDKNRHTGGHDIEIRSLVHRTQPGQILQLPLYNLRGSLDRYHANGIWGNRWLSVAFADDPRLGWSGDKFHSREPQYGGFAGPKFDGFQMNPYRPIQQGEGGVCHLWGSDELRLREKHRLYRLTERVRWPHKSAEEINKLYNLWRSPADSAAMWPDHLEFQKTWTYAEVPKEWMEPYKELIEKYLYLEIEPWQTAECERIIAEHGREFFAGIDLT